jgi:hypothetical protein
MKFGKEEIQKMVLGGMVFAGVTVAYFTLLLGPLGDSVRLTQGEMSELRPKLDAAKKQIKQASEKEKSAPKSTLVLKELTALIPEGSPVAWFPTQVGDFFKREGIDKAATHMNGEAPDASLPGFRRIVWGVDIPRVEFVSLGQSLADFENEQLLTEISNLQIESMRDDVESLRVTLTLNNIVKQ